MLHNSSEIPNTLFTNQLLLLPKVFQNNIKYRIESTNRHKHLDSILPQLHQKSFCCSILLTVHEIFENDIGVNKNFHNFSNTILIKQSLIQEFFYTAFGVCHKTTQPKETIGIILKSLQPLYNTIIFPLDLGSLKLISVFNECFPQLLFNPQLHGISSIKMGSYPLQHSIINSYIICTHISSMFIIPPQIYE